MLEKLGGGGFMVDRDTLSYRSGIKISRNNFISFLSVSSLWFEVVTRACPVAATCPVAVSLWQHCPHVVERETTRAPEWSQGSSLSV